VGLLNGGCPKIGNGGNPGRVTVLSSLRSWRNTAGGMSSFVMSNSLARSVKVFTV
jgi:hypothetical protein